MESTSLLEALLIFLTGLRALRYKTVLTSSTNPEWINWVVSILLMWDCLLLLLKCLGVLVIWMATIVKVQIAWPSALMGRTTGTTSMRTKPRTSSSPYLSIPTLLRPSTTPRPCGFFSLSWLNSSIILQYSQNSTLSFHLHNIHIYAQMLSQPTPFHLP